MLYRVVGRHRQPVRLREHPDARGIPAGVSGDERDLVGLQAARVDACEHRLAVRQQPLKLSPARRGVQDEVDELVVARVEDRRRRRHHGDFGQQPHDEVRSSLLRERELLGAVADGVAAVGVGRRTAELLLLTEIAVDRDDCHAGPREAEAIPRGAMDPELLHGARRAVGAAMDAHERSPRPCRC